MQEVNAERDQSIRGKFLHSVSQEFDRNRKLKQSDCTIIQLTGVSLLQREASSSYHQPSYYQRVGPIRGMMSAHVFTVFF